MSKQPLISEKAHERQHTIRGMCKREAVTAKAYAEYQQDKKEGRMNTLIKIAPNFKKLMDSYLLSKAFNTHENCIKHVIKPFVKNVLCPGDVPENREIITKHIGRLIKGLEKANKSEEERIALSLESYLTRLVSTKYGTITGGKRRRHTRKRKKRTRKRRGGSREEWNDFFADTLTVLEGVYINNIIQSDGLVPTRDGEMIQEYIRIFVECAEHAMNFILREMNVNTEEFNTTNKERRRNQLLEQIRNKMGEIRNRINNQETLREELLSARQVVFPKTNYKYQMQPKRKQGGKRRKRNLKKRTKRRRRSKRRRRR